MTVVPMRRRTGPGFVPMAVGPFRARGDELGRDDVARAVIIERLLDPLPVMRTIITIKLKVPALFAVEEAMKG